jgi:class 3 adenylate cyclase
MHASLTISTRIIALMLLLSAPGSSQKQGAAEIDSLEKALRKHSAEDFTRVNLLVRIASISNEKRYVTASEGYDIAKKLEYKWGEARCAAILGRHYYEMYDYTIALEMYGISLKYFEGRKDHNIVLALQNEIGAVYTTLRNYDKALEYHLRALKIAENIGSQKDICLNSCAIARSYQAKSDLDKAEEYCNKALTVACQIKDSALVAMSTMQLALNWVERKKYREAAGLFSQANKSADQRDDYQQCLDVYTSTALMYLHWAKDTSQASSRLNGVLSKKERTACLNKAVDNCISAYVRTMLHPLKVNWPGLFLTWSEANRELGNFKKANSELERLRQYEETAQREETQKKTAAFAAQKERELKAKELIILQEQAARKNLILFFSGGIAAIMIFFLYIVWMERGKSEKLLLNILPKQIAKRLKKKEQYIADQFREASVIFIDIAGFTPMSKATTAEEIVQMLDKVYSEFDQVAEKYQIEKIKTIGDCYMAAAGIPEERKDHAQAASNFARETMRRMNGYKSENGYEIRFRVGIDCGPMVAGVIGKKKFIYDLWGDAVNTAARMEQYGEPGKIQITDRFKKSLQGSLSVETAEDDDATDRMTFVERGEIEIKGKGIMKTWWMDV